MFNSTPFHFDLIRKYIITFGTLFNNIYTTREDKDGNSVSRIRVPLTYGPKEKSLTRVVQDPAVDRPVAVYPLPMMSFEMTGFSYDGSRKLQTINRIAFNDPDDNQLRRYQYNPVPYNIGFKLSIFIKNAEDGTRIVEQILPYFTPDWTVTALLIPEMDIRHDIPVILNTVNLSDVYEGNFETRRTMIWELDFTLKGYLYGPVKSTKVIKYAITQLYNNLDRTSSPVATIEIQPGLTGNGQPTSNASLSIPVDEIVATDDFGFVINITEPSIPDEL
jgi:hypothetical protein